MTQMAQQENTSRVIYRISIMPWSPLKFPDAADHKVVVALNKGRGEAT
jgi:hypothetical protein